MATATAPGSVKLLGAARAIERKRENQAGIARDWSGSGIRSVDAAADQPIRRARVCIISEGPGNLADRHWYTREAIESGVAVFEGAKAFADHPSRREEIELPERSVRQLIGHFEKCAVESGRDGRAALMADLVLNPADSDLMRHVRGLIREAADHAALYPDMQPHSGLSINADGEDAPAEINGEQWNAVTRLTAAISADVVTFPAARGGWTRSLESLRDAVGSGRTKEASAMKIKIVRESNEQLRKLAAKLAKTDDAEARKTIHAEMEGYMKASDEAAEAANVAASDKEKAEAEAKKKAEDDLKAAGVPADKKDDEEPEEEARKKASLTKKAGELKESAKVLRKAGNEELAAALEDQAKALESKATDFASVREELRESNRKVQVLESVLSGRRLLTGSTLPEGYISIDELVGMSESKQKAKIEAEERRYAKIRESMAGDFAVVGAGPRSISTPTKSKESLAASLKQAGVEV
jgi:hypothetical protein